MLTLAASSCRAERPAEAGILGPYPLRYLIADRFAYDGSRSKGWLLSQMPVSEDQIDAILRRPAEALQIEVKTWLDTSQPDDIARLVRAVFAVRNRDGGFIVIGFNDETLLPDPYSLSESVDAAYHVDRIQSIVSRYAAEAFEIEVAMRERDGQRHPVIVVPAGVQVPAVVKSALVVNGGKKLLIEGALFFRTLNSNGTPSSAQIHPRDYRDLLTICFDNREADIGRFVRRQLAGTDLSALAGYFSVPVVATAANLRSRALAALDDLDQRFLHAVDRRNAGQDLARVNALLTMEVAMVLDPERPDEVPSRAFMNKIDAANPHYTGWPAWLDTRSFHNEADRANVIDGAWEALVSDLDAGWSKHFEYLRFDPRGLFYLRRVMQDDLSDKVPPGTALDPPLMIYRVTEILAVGVAIARAAGWNDDAVAGFAFKWKGLSGRRLRSWVDFMNSVGASGTSFQPSAVSYLEIALSTPVSAIPSRVVEAVRPLFAQFDGCELKPETLEAHARKVIDRTLS